MSIQTSPEAKEAHDIRKARTGYMSGTQTSPARENSQREKRSFWPEVGVDAPPPTSTALSTEASPPRHHDKVKGRVEGILDRIDEMHEELDSIRRESEQRSPSRSRSRSRNERSVQRDQKQTTPTAFTSPPREEIAPSPSLGREYSSADERHNVHLLTQPVYDSGGKLGAQKGVWYENRSQQSPQVPEKRYGIRTPEMDATASVELQSARRGVSPEATSSPRLLDFGDVVEGERAAASIRGNRNEYDNPQSRWQYEPPPGHPARHYSVEREQRRYPEEHIASTEREYPSELHHDPYERSVHGGGGGGGASGYGERVSPGYGGGGGGGGVGYGSPISPGYGGEPMSYGEVREAVSPGYGGYGGGGATSSPGYGGGATPPAMSPSFTPLLKTYDTPLYSPQHPRAASTSMRPPAPSSFPPPGYQVYREKEEPMAVDYARAVAASGRYEEEEQSRRRRRAASARSGRSRSGSKGGRRREGRSRSRSRGGSRSSRGGSRSGRSSSAGSRGSRGSSRGRRGSSRRRRRSSAHDDSSRGGLAGYERYTHKGSEAEGDVVPARFDTPPHMRNLPASHRESVGSQRRRRSSRSRSRRSSTSASSRGSSRSRSRSRSKKSSRRRRRSSHGSTSSRHGGGGGGGGSPRSSSSSRRAPRDSTTYKAAPQLSCRPPSSLSPTTPLSPAQGSMWGAASKTSHPAPSSRSQSPRSSRRRRREGSAF